ncbi:hypothetical protein [Nonomuraea sp. NPDC046570]|uniref:hypothetical protein n=1 Tax=Nonomuraea sp. NPDC046570 TaxID=3155255 RepID=UPI0033C00A73
MDTARRSVEAMLAADAASAGLGIELLEVGPGHAVCGRVVAEFRGRSRRLREDG